MDARGAGSVVTHLDEPLFDGAGVNKRDLVTYLDAVADQLVTDLRDRPLSVIRARPGQPPFMQKNLPPHAPEWVRTVRLWAEASRREVAYALCDDRRTLMWFANQRAVEYHPALVRAERMADPLFLVLDLDPPDPGGFAAAVRVAHLVRRTLADAGLTGAVKTTGAKGVHIFVPVTGVSWDDVAAAARAIAARTEQLDPSLATTAFIKEDRNGKVFVDSTRVYSATVAAVYTPRVRPGVPVSFPVAWDELDGVTPTDFTVGTAPGLLRGRDPWSESMPPGQTLEPDLVAEGRAIPVARAQALREGRRRAVARRRG